MRRRGKGVRLGRAVRGVPCARGGRVAVCFWPSWCATRALCARGAVLGTDTNATAPLEPLEVMITKSVCEQVV